MPDTASRGRRRLLSTLAAGGLAAPLLPTAWTRPVVDSAALPAHATATSPAGGLGSLGGITYVYASSGGSSTPSLLDLFVGQANAESDGDCDVGALDSLCAVVNGTSVLVYARFVVVGCSTHGLYRMVYSGTVQLGAPAVPLQRLTNDDCEATFQSDKWASSPSVEAVSLNGNSLTLRLSAPDPQPDLVLVPGPCSMPELVCGGNAGDASDRAIKHAVAPLDVECVLDGVAALPVSTWSYNDSPGIRHIGPMAQDFMAAFGLGDSDRHIHNVDANGVALAAIQGLYARLQQKDETIRTLEARLEALEGRLTGSEVDEPK